MKINMKPRADHHLLSMAIALLLSLCAGALPAADYAAAVDELIPRLADPEVPRRYEAQMQLQDLASQSSRPGNDTERAALGAVLAAKVADATVPQPARIWMVRQLEYMGREEAVAALTRLLNGEGPELRECARRALEKNSAAGAGDSLRAALERGGEESWRIGLMHALGERRDAAAVALIGRELKDSKTGWAAALALGAVANDAAIAALWGALPENLQADSALINAANRRLAAGDIGAAKAVFGKLNDAEQPVPIRAAALAGLIRAEPRAAGGPLAEGLTSNEPRLQAAVIHAAQAALGEGASAALARLLPQVSSAASLQILAVVGSPAEAAAMAAARDQGADVQVAALGALGRMGSAAAVPVLLQAALSESKEVRSAAGTALARISGPGAGPAIAQAAARGDARVRAVAISSLAARNELSVRPELADYAEEPEGAVRQAALEALGRLGSDSSVERLGKLALAGKDSEAIGALEAVAGRVEDRAAAAQKLLALAGADEPAVAVLANALAMLGGPEALAAVSRVATGANASARDAAVRALSNWSGYEAVEPLLALAKNPEVQGAAHVLALGGAVRLVKTAENQSPADRAAKAQAILEAARGESEKKMALSMLGTIPHPDMVATVKSWLVKPEYKAEAAQAGLMLVKSLKQSERALARDLAEAIKGADVSANMNQQVDKALQ